MAERSTSEEPVEDMASVGGAARSDPGGGAGERPDPDNVRRVRRRPAGPARNTIAANDDVASIGGLIFALHQRPSRRIFVFAAAATGLWLVISGVLGYAMLSGQMQPSASLPELLRQPSVATVFATITAPIGVFWILAYMIWSAIDMKMKARALAEVAVRMVEPDRTAQQSVASLGQSVRQQVVFIDDAIKKAIGRAGELESIVHNEVAALERSYSENEFRVRRLIDELASERQSLERNSAQVSDSLNGIGNHITQQIAAASRHATETLVQSARELANLIENRTGAIAASATAAGAVLDEKLSERGNAMLNSLSDMAQRIGNEVPQVIDRMTQEQVRLSRIIEASTSNLSALEQALASRTGELGHVLEEQTRAVDRSFGAHTKALTSTMDGHRQRMEAGIAKSVQSVDEAIIRGTAALDRSVSQRTLALANAMEQHAATLGESLTRKAADLDRTLITGVEAVRRTSENITMQSVRTIEGLANQASMLKEVSENLLSQIHSLTSRFENQGKSIAKAAHALETSNLKIDTVLQARHSELADLLERMGDRARLFDRAAQSYSSSIDQTLTETERRAREAAEKLTRATQDRSREVTAHLQQFRSTAEQQTEQAVSDLRRRFGDITQEMSTQLETVSTRARDLSQNFTRTTQSQSAETERAIGDLRGRMERLQEDLSRQMASVSSRFNETSDEMRDRARRSAEELEAMQARLRQQMESLPETGRNSAESIRRTLSDQLAALDQLTALAGRQSGGRDVRGPHGGPHPGNGPQQPGGYPPPAAPAQQVSAQPPGTLSDVYQNRLREQLARAPQQPDPSQERAGWSMGDLLNRASRDEQQPAHPALPPPGAAPEAHVPAPEPPKPAKPVAINVARIGQALDPITTAEVWTRHRAGQRPLFSLDMYSNEGREIFEEIARRYPVDPGFRASVDRYLDYFEGLLKDSENREPGMRNAENYLISESGRVYLVLAHASGRLV